MKRINGAWNLICMCCLLGLSSCIFKPNYELGSQAECESCEETVHCCCGLTCQVFVIKGGSLNGIPVKRCDSDQTQTCPD